MSESMPDTSAASAAVPAVLSPELWMVGSEQLWMGTPAGGWNQVGEAPARILAIQRVGRAAVVVATMGGLWLVDSPADRWLQLHDETVTEVQDVSLLGAEAHELLAAACPYGVAVLPGQWSNARPWEDRDQRTREGPRWRFLSDDLTVNERFCSALLAEPPAAHRSAGPAGSRARLLVATEAGVLRLELAPKNSGHGTGRTDSPPSFTWERTALAGTACRALCRWNGRYWAAAERGGVWSSGDGLRWEPAGVGLEDEAVFSLAVCGARESAHRDNPSGLLLAGTAHGPAWGDGRGPWRRGGPRMLVSAAACSGGSWLVGGTPGGLWSSADAGASWKQIRGHVNVGAILAPEKP